ncbi:hypothetical protein [Bacillus methanolicus]|uniref:Uncharacterized protein n=1 Tax=Bacillus methanolicus (strain MGA3 / ATCC 53907) TaxID=796606 RepID=I3EAI5_BACMM|nr:hypothetical protein [Bacillus methanolicus]AIE60746.1 hypothetical protein BMMGA3_11755 [Bacillus methanolicus MGA3]EIJ83506.1 hypothetical protein MGA3_09810 [Bacillus methanolicus MGA3]
MLERNLQRIVVGSALAIATTALIPVVRNTLRPIIWDLSRQMKYLIVTAKEGIEDMAAEVKFERIRKSLDKDIFIDGEMYEEENQNRINL